jgi:hypothetical protein
MAYAKEIAQVSLRQPILSFILAGSSEGLTGTSNPNAKVQATM